MSDWWMAGESVVILSVSLSNIPVIGSLVAVVASLPEKGSERKVSDDQTRQRQDIVSLDHVDATSLDITRCFSATKDSASSRLKQRGDFGR